MHMSVRANKQADGFPSTSIPPITLPLQLPNGRRCGDGGGGKSRDAQGQIIQGGREKRVLASLTQDLTFDLRSGQLAGQPIHLRLGKEIEFQGRVLSISGSDFLFFVPLALLFKSLISLALQFGSIWNPRVRLIIMYTLPNDTGASEGQPPAL